MPEGTFDSLTMSRYSDHFCDTPEIGGGGGGGVIFLIYKKLTDNGVTLNINGGAGASGWNYGGNGGNGPKGIIIKQTI